MAGGTTFHFVTGGIREALARARDVAKDRDVRLGGGVATIRQYLEAGLVDEMHLAITPVLLAVVLAVLLHVGEVVVEGRVDDAVGRLCGGVQAVQVVHVAAEDLRPGTSGRLGARVRTTEPDHVMACVDEFPVAPVRDTRILHHPVWMALGSDAPRWRSVVGSAWPPPARARGPGTIRPGNTGVALA